jgi:NhaA family Na+:H+ antiporter
VSAAAAPYAEPLLLERVLGPFHRFFSKSASGGLVLLASTAVALGWANSPWAESYHHLWETPLTVGTPGFGLTLSVHAWVNDGLMAVFFFLVGLEIKREVLVGELASRRSAALPVAAALGGMLVPAALYALVNRGGPGAAGWGVPMATDIAFALGILALLGDRVPSGLRVFLAALAIADDLGAVLVIAFFYTGALNLPALGGAAAVLAVLAGLNRAGARRPLTYALLGVALWLCVLASGVHATIAGVLLALAVPARTRIDEDEFLARAEASLADFRAADEPGTTVLTNRGHQEALQALESAADAAQAPLQRMEHALHGVVAFVIMPVFALANAGVPLGAGLGAAARSPVAWGVVLGLRSASRWASPSRAGSPCARARPTCPRAWRGATCTAPAGSAGSASRCRSSSRGSRSPIPPCWTPPRSASSAPRSSPARSGTCCCDAATPPAWARRRGWPRSRYPPGPRDGRRARHAPRRRGDVAVGAAGRARGAPALRGPPRGVRAAGRDVAARARPRGPRARRALVPGARVRGDGAVAGVHRVAAGRGGPGGRHGRGGRPGARGCRARRRCRWTSARPSRTRPRRPR